MRWSSLGFSRVQIQPINLEEEKAHIYLLDLCCLFGNFRRKRLKREKQKIKSIFGLKYAFFLKFGLKVQFLMLEKAH